jgi:hypothetical protein
MYIPGMKPYMRSDESPHGIELPMKRPICVEPTHPWYKCDQMSRINYGKVYTVDTFREGRGKTPLPPRSLLQRDLLPPNSDEHLPYEPEWLCTSTVRFCRHRGPFTASDQRRAEYKPRRWLTPQSKLFLDFSKSTNHGSGWYILRRSRYRKRQRDG